MEELTTEDKQELYAWIDKVPLSRQKKNISRDFSDGVMAAELAYYYFPRLVDLHNYTSANSTSQKLNNWRTLNRKVFSKLDFEVPDQILQDIVASQPGVIEYLLCHFKAKVEQFHNQSQKGNALSLPTINDNTLISSQDIVSNEHTSPNSTFPHVPSRLPPLLDHASKNPPKPSYIPRPRHSGHNSHHTFPSVTNQTSSLSYNNKTSSKPEQALSTKLPPIKDGLSKKKIASYSSQHPSLLKPDKSASLEMAEKDQVIMELQETIQLLSMKVNRLEHLVRLKDYRIQELERIIVTNNIKKR